MAVRRRDWGRVVAAALAMTMLTADRSPIFRTQSAPAAEAPIAPSRLFISGHSLTNRPFPDHLAAIAAAGGVTLEWDLQHRYGSTLADRVDVALRDGARYDAVLLAERSTMLESVMWHDTVGHVVTMAKRARAENPQTHTFLFASWMSVGDPAHWIAYEKAAAPAWTCLARAAEQRGAGKVTVVPAAEALALLVERVGPLEVFTDEVHLSEAGTYFVALVTHATLYGGLPDKLSVPAGVGSEMVTKTQGVAKEFLDRPRAEHASDCRIYMADRFAPAYLAYARDVQWSKLGWARSHARWLRYRLAWPARLRSRSAGNPLGAS